MTRRNVLSIALALCAGCITLASSLVFSPGCARIPATLPTGGTCRRRCTSPLLSPQDEVDIGSTFFTHLDSMDDEIVLSDGTLMPGDDVMERELKRIFSVESSNGTFAGDEFDEVKLMYKLRKELGDEDFRKIFDDVRVRGPMDKF